MTPAIRNTTLSGSVALLVAAAGCSSSSSSTAMSDASTASDATDGSDLGNVDGNFPAADVSTPATDGACDACAIEPMCPAWTTFNFPNGMEGHVGDTLTLMVNASGSDPAHLTYSWSTSNPIGTFGVDHPSGPSDTNTFTCTARGTTTLTLVIGPIPGDAAACAVPTNVLTEMFTCDPAGADGGAADGGDASHPDAASPVHDAGTHD